MFVGWLGGKSVGARALVIRDQDILLVRHTYNRGWYTIGGAVEAGETPSQALKRELKEEVDIDLLEDPELFSVYYNYFERRHDYVVLYIIKHFNQTESDFKTGVAQFEIAEKRWFPLNQLPHDISEATKRRIEEYLGTRTRTEFW